MKKIYASTLSLIVMSTAQVIAADIVIPHTFTADTTAKASEVNENFTVLKDAVNSNKGQIAVVQTAAASNATAIQGNATAIEANVDSITQNSSDIVSIATNMGKVRTPAGYEVIYVGGNAWLDRNIGATAVASSWNDTTPEVLGDLFQWGRKADGHQLRSSTISTTCSIYDDTTNNDTFIQTTTETKNWRTINADCTGNPDRTYFWSATGSRLNGVCPAGWRVPAQEDFDALDLQSGEDAYNKIKLVAAGHRAYNDGSIGGVGTAGSYWTATTAFAADARSMAISGGGTAEFYWNRRAAGFSVRCMKELP